MCLHNTIHLDSCIFIFTFQSVKYYFISLFLSNPSTSTHIAYSDTTSLTSLLSPSVAKNISCDDSNPHSLLHKQIPAVTVVTDCLGVHVANTPLHVFSKHIILIKLLTLAVLFQRFLLCLQLLESVVLKHLLNTIQFLLLLLLVIIQQN